MGGQHQPAAAELKIEQGLEPSLAFLYQIPAGDAGVGCAVRHEFGNVLGVDEEGLELAAQRGGERPVGRAPNVEPGVLEQFAGVAGQPALVG